MKIHFKYLLILFFLLTSSCINISSNNKFTYKGFYNYPSGDKYIGEFDLYGNPNGQGTITYSNGDKYIGGFKNGKPNGEGSYTFSNGDKYVGEFRDDKKNGHGTLTYSNGDKYVGNFKDDKSDGEGVLTYNNCKYEGIFKEGEIAGRGSWECIYKFE